MYDKLNKLRSIKRLNTWTDSKLLEVYSDFDISNMATYKIINIAIEYIKGHSLKRISIFSKEFYIIRGWSEDDAINKVSEIQKKNGHKFIEKRQASPENYPQCISPMSLQFWINKGFSEDDAYIEIKKQRPINKEYWTSRGFSEDQAILKISEFQSNQGKKLIARKKENPSRYEDTSSNKLKYWLNKTDGDIDLAKKLLKERQSTFSLEKCKQRYGEEEGFRRWKDRQDKWKSKVFNKDTYIGSGKSNVSMEFFEILNSKVKDNKYPILYGANEKFIHDGTRAFKYDFTILGSKKIIEFNGDYWHCNPLKFNNNYYHAVKKMTAVEIWEYDKYKKNLAESHGYSVLIIWEHDYRENPEKEIIKCLNFINND